MSEIFKLANFKVLSVNNSTFYVAKQLLDDEFLKGSLSDCLFIFIDSFLNITYSF